MVLGFLLASGVSLSKLVWFAKLEDAKVVRFAKLEDCGSMHFGVREIWMRIFQLSRCHHRVWSLGFWGNMRSKIMMLLGIPLEISWDGASSGYASSRILHKFQSEQKLDKGWLGG